MEKIKEGISLPKTTCGAEVNGRYNVLGFVDPVRETPNNYPGLSNLNQSSRRQTFIWATSDNYNLQHKMYHTTLHHYKCCIMGQDHSHTMWMTTMF